MTPSMGQHQTTSSTLARNRQSLAKPNNALPSRKVPSVDSQIRGDELDGGGVQAEPRLMAEEFGHHAPPGSLPVPRPPGGFCGQEGVAANASANIGVLVARKGDGGLRSQ